MFDHIFAFPDETTAHAVLDPPGFGSEEGWDQSRVLPVQIGVGHQPGQDGQEGAPIFAAGYWLVVSLPFVDDDLWSIPACMRIADRYAREAGQDYVLRDRFSAEQLASPWWITPQWCGVSYDNKGDQQ